MINAGGAGKGTTAPAQDALHDRLALSGIKRDASGLVFFYWLLTRASHSSEGVGLGFEEFALGIRIAMSH